MGTMEERQEKLQRAVIDAIENMSFLEGGCCVEAGGGLLPDNAQLHQASLTICSPQRSEFQVQITSPLLHEIVKTLFSVAAEEITQEMENDVLADVLTAVAEKVLHGEPQVVRCGNANFERQCCKVICRFEQEQKLLAIVWEQAQPALSETAATLQNGIDY